MSAGGRGVSEEYWAVSAARRRDSAGRAGPTLSPVASGARLRNSATRPSHHGEGPVGTTSRDDAEVQIAGQSAGNVASPGAGEGGMPAAAGGVDVGEVPGPAVQVEGVAFVKVGHQLTAGVPHGDADPCGRFPLRGRGAHAKPRGLAGPSRVSGDGGSTGSGSRRWPWPGGCAGPSQSTVDSRGAISATHASCSFWCRLSSVSSSARSRVMMVCG